MPTAPATRAELCNCLAIRQAARHVTQFYDQCLAPTGLRATQFAVLSRLQRLGPMTVNALARELVMDRTTLGRNVLPLEREGLVAAEPGRRDRRRKELRVTEAGAARLHTATQRWTEAQAGFESAFGAERAAELRAMMRAVAATDLSGPESGA